MRVDDPQENDAFVVRQLRNSERAYVIGCVAAEQVACALRVPAPWGAMPDSRAGCANGARPIAGIRDSFDELEPLQPPARPR